LLIAESAFFARRCLRSAASDTPLAPINHKICL
jgi:hypothetical protein